MTPKHVPTIAPPVQTPASTSPVSFRESHSNVPVVPTTLPFFVTSASDPAEIEASIAAEAATHGRRVPPSRARAHARKIYRQVAQSPAAPAGLIVEDETAAPDTSRMRKSDFVDAVQDAMCHEVEEGFAGSQYEGRGCPFVTEAMDFYRRLPAESLEASIRRYAPEAASVRRARDYVPLMTRRVRVSVDTFVRTGRIEGIPPEMQPLAAMAMLRGSGGFGGLLTTALGGVLGAIGGALLGAGQAIGGAIRALFKHRSESVGPAVDAHSVRVGLGAGSHLDAAVRSRMERAFGHDFSNVRIHAGERSGAMAASLGARAMTVGNDVAFAPGEYQPGTPVGDAIIAHELAHTIQQGDATTPSAPAYGLEDDADAAAASAIGSLWGGERDARANPRRRSGLQLQRCSGSSRQTRATTAPRGNTQAQGTPAPAGSCTPINADDWFAHVRAALAIDAHDFPARTAAMLPLIRQALCDSGREIVETTNPGAPQEDPAHYQATPRINFDAGLNFKTKYSTGDSLQDNSAHSFDIHNRPPTYVILGPRALNPNYPASVKRWMEHELFHTTTHEAGSNPRRLSVNDQELEAHTRDFVRYFHRLGTFSDSTQGLVYLGDQWTVLLGHYGASANTSLRDETFNALVGYYRNPPVPAGERDHVLTMFRLWLTRRATHNSGLPQRLMTELRIP
jgi:uncharacterized protein DUF4157